MPNWILLKNGIFVVNINKNASTSIKEHRLDHKYRPPIGHKVAVFRNPYDRLVSCFEDRPDYDGMTFPTFIDYVCSTSDEEIDSHCRSQNLELEPWPDQIINFENINEEFEKLGITLKQRNKSDHKHWSAYYDKDQLKRVKERFRRDFEIWELLETQ